MESGHFLDEYSSWSSNSDSNAFTENAFGVKKSTGAEAELGGNVPAQHRVLSSAPAEVGNWEKWCPGGVVAVVVIVLEKPWAQGVGGDRSLPSKARSSQWPCCSRKAYRFLQPAQPRAQAQAPAETSPLGRPPAPSACPAPNPRHGPVAPAHCAVT